LGKESARSEVSGLGKMVEETGQIVVDFHKAGKNKPNAYHG